VLFRSEEYPLARFVLWLREQGYLDGVRRGVEAAGKEWSSELRHLYVSPVLAKAVLDVYPDFAPSAMEARKQLKEQFPNVQDVSNQQMVDARYFLAEEPSVKEARRKLGYNKTSNFARDFKRWYGVTPGQFLKDHRRRQQKVGF